MSSAAVMIGALKVKSDVHIKNCSEPFEDFSPFEELCSVYLDHVHVGTTLPYVLVLSFTNS